MKDEFGNDIIEDRDEFGNAVLEAQPDDITPAEPAKGLFRRGLDVAARWLDRVPAAARGAMGAYQKNDAPGAMDAAWEGLKNPESAPTSPEVMAGFGADTAQTKPQIRTPAPGAQFNFKTMDFTPAEPETTYTSQAQELGNALDMVLPSGLEFLPVGMAAKALRKPLAKPIRAGAERIQQTVLRPRTGDWNAGFDVANIEKHGLQGSVDEVLSKSDTQIKDHADKLRALIQEGADDGVSLDLHDVLAKSKAKLLKDAPADLASKLDDIFDEFGSWANLETGRGGREIGVDLLKGQEFKQMMGAHGAWEKTAAAKNMGITEGERYRSRAAQQVYLTLKDEIEKVAPDGIREANKALSELIPIRNAAAYRKIVADRNNPISLSDMLSAMTAVGNGPAGAALFGAQKFTTKGFGAKSLYSLAKLLDGPQAKEAAEELKKSFGLDEADLAALRTRNDPFTGPAGRNRPNLAGTRRSLAEPEPGADLPPQLRGSINWNPEPAGRPAFHAKGTRRPLVDEPEPDLMPRRPVGDIPSNFPPYLREVPGFRDVLEGARSRRPLDLPDENALPPRRPSVQGQRAQPEVFREPEAFRDILNNFGRRPLSPATGPQDYFPAAHGSEPWTPSSLPPDLMAQLPEDVQAALMARLRSLAAPTDEHLPPYLRGR